MHRYLALMMLVGCSEPTPEERVQDLLKSSVVCGTVRETSVLTTSCEAPSVPPDQIVACMSDALSQGRQAVVAWYKEDSQLWGYAEYAFAIDGSVDLIDYYPGRWRGGDGPHVAFEKTCAGSFRSDTFMCPFNGTTIPTVRVDGCGP